MGRYEIRLPELGEGLHEGTIGKWLVKPGDTVKEDDAIAEVENDKALVELPTPVDGTVKEIHVEEGTVATVGDLLMTLEVEGEGNASGDGHAVTQTERQVTDATQGVARTGTEANTAEGMRGATAEDGEQQTNAQPAAVAPANTAPAATPESVHGASVHSAAREVLATPGVRKYARDRQVNIENVTGTGPNGKITVEDVDMFLQRKSAPITPAPSSAVAAQEVGTDGASAEVPTTPVASGTEREERIKLTQIRKVIAKSMAKSMYTAPHVTVMDEANVTELVKMREELKPMAAGRGVKLTYLPFVVKALVAALRIHPTLNGTYDEENQELVVKHYYHIGIATDTDRGLLVPVVRDADRKNMWQIAAEISDLAGRGRDGKLGANELRGSTISITNIGSAGGLFFTPVINYPELAILGVGRITERPIMQNGEVVGAHMMAFSLSFDHRMIDGVLAQQCVNDIKRLLENPRLLLMEV
ncbi:dihydrolipoamide acetyltransferase family protein [Alicyclobacillus sp. ALC3]|uniref:dihydrolipoamide acetyltransferase family protein n=1 Tax=Alicyclobacillus sp. ALC3 TaxID=2796143 RepID=UPI0023783E34|nr:dihydrolipoamide acetyltransferase family protein [Alicyclobacillus sp. ALC3]WDL98654.1 2-oxo acid dehydrogenase subunit E2 [Alicyclobacillus sp. ALC3]